MPVRLRMFPLSQRSTFLMIVCVFFFFYLGDSMMAFLSPVIMERVFQSTILMGVMYSSSSVVGIVTDFLFARFFSDKKSTFFLRILFSLSFFFPIAFLFFPNPLGFLMGMVIWGVYYEARSFSKYLMIKEHIPKQQFSWAWGVLSVVQNIALVLGPFLAGVLIGFSDRTALLTVLFFFICASYMMIGVLFHKRKYAHPHLSVQQTASHTFFQQIKIWATFEKSLWPMLGFSILFFLIDSAFFTVGPLLALQLKELHSFGGVFVSLYSLPGLFMGLSILSLTKVFGKKRVAFIAGIFSGLGLLVMSFMQSPVLILSFTLFSAVGLSVLYPSLASAFEDYVSRAGKYANDLIGLSSVSAGIAYVIGPTLNGILAELFSLQVVFGIWGGVLFIVSTILLFTIKGKIRLPQKELEEVKLSR